MFPHWSFVWMIYPLLTVGQWSPLLIYYCQVFFPAILLLLTSLMYLGALKLGVTCFIKMYDIIYIFLKSYSIFSLIEFIRVTSVRNFHRFQVHNSPTHHLYTVLCVHHPSQVSTRHHLSPRALSTIPTLLPPAAPQGCPCPWGFFKQLTMGALQCYLRQGIEELHRYIFLKCAISKCFFTFNEKQNHIKFIFIKYCIFARTLCMYKIT